MKYTILPFLTFLIFLSCTPRKKNNANLNTIESYDSLFISIDHIPIVVNDLEKVKNIFKNQLYFALKEGKTHDGIKNCFVKFQNGTYLEFISPTDSLQTIGKYYFDFLKTRQGGTAMAISIKNTDLAKKILTEKNILFSADSNKFWKTIEPENSELFFIEYTDHSWKENPTNTNHSNTSTSLNSTYYLSDDINKEAKKYKYLGFTETEKGQYLETPYILFKIGQSNLYLLDGKNSSKIHHLLNTKKLKGICGFEIKINSLQTFNQQIKHNENIKYENNKTTIYFKDYNIFMIFSENIK